MKKQKEIMGNMANLIADIETRNNKAYEAACEREAPVDELEYLNGEMSLIKDIKASLGGDFTGLERRREYEPGLE